MSGEHGAIERRRFLLAIGSGATLAMAGCAATGGGAPRSAGPAAKDEEEISPGEDLMREHGVLNRILLVYEEFSRRIDADEPAPLEILEQSAALIRRLIEDYHERLEEEFLFPRFESAGRDADLVRVLRLQHVRGRALTDRVIEIAGREALLSGTDRSRLAGVLRSFTRMYRPHEAREDTVLFPAFRDVVGASACRELGWQFEEREHALFGEHGFGGVVREVADLERALGIYDLAQFTAP